MNIWLKLLERLSGGGLVERAHAVGGFHAKLFDASGRLLREIPFANTVVTVGKNQAWDAALAGSAYTVTGPYMGLISSVSFTGTTASDTMASHSGWTECNATNAPTYGTTRPTCVWSAASGGAKALSSALSFTFTNSGTVQGAFIVYGPAATNSNTGTVGTLFSAGAFSTAQPVISGNVLQVSYTVSM